MKNKQGRNEIKTNEIKGYADKVTGKS